MADPRLRQLTIKTGVVKRLAKERTVYEKEIQTEHKRFDKFKAEGADEHKLKKQEEVIQECLMMVPDTTRRLRKEFEALEKFVADEQDLKETKEYQAAQEILAEAQKVLIEA